MRLDLELDPDEPTIALDLSTGLRHALLSCMREAGLVQRQITALFERPAYAFPRLVAADVATTGDLDKAFGATGHDITISLGDEPVHGKLIEAVAEAVTLGENLRVVVDSRSSL